MSAPEARFLAALKGHEGQVYFALFVADSQRIATGDDRTIQVWSLPALWWWRMREKRRAANQHAQAGLQQAGVWIRVQVLQHGHPYCGHTGAEGDALGGKELADARRVDVDCLRTVDQSSTGGGGESSRAARRDMDVSPR